MRSSDDFCKPVEAVQRTQFEGGVAPRHSYDVTVMAQHSNAFNIIVKPAVLYQSRYPDSKIHVVAMGPTWDLTAPDGPHIGPVTLAIRVGLVHPYYIPAITPIRNNCALGTCNKSSFILQINGNNMVTNLQTVFLDHYSDVIMSTMASQITSLAIVCSTVCLGKDQRKHQSSASLDFVGEFTGELRMKFSMIMMWSMCCCIICYSPMMTSWYGYASRVYWRASITEGQ